MWGNSFDFLSLTTQEYQIAQAMSREKCIKTKTIFIVESMGY
jgi:hypothetical protein